jgi:hypothetical protein
MNEKISLDNGLPAGQIHNLIHDVKINPGAIVRP